MEALLPRLGQHENKAFQAAHRDRYNKDHAAVEAETVSGPDAAIAGIYLTKVINKHAAADALFVEDDGTVRMSVRPHASHTGMPAGGASALIACRCIGPLCSPIIRATRRARGAVPAH